METITRYVGSRSVRRATRVVHSFPVQVDLTICWPRQPPQRDMCWQLAYCSNLDQPSQQVTRRRWLTVARYSPAFVSLTVSISASWTGPSVLSTHKFAKRFGGWVAWSSGVTGTAFVAAHLHPMRHAVVFGIAVEVCAYKLICMMAVF